MEKIMIYIFATALMTFGVQSFVPASLPNVPVFGDETKQEMKLVAQADGKGFYAELAIMNSWADAQYYCEFYGMNLAEITSKAQWDALNANATSMNGGGHWISGRDSLSLTQFAWDKSEGSANQDYIYFEPLLKTPQTCLLFVPVQNNYSHVRNQLCSQRGYLLLCEAPL